MEDDDDDDRDDSGINLKAITWSRTGEESQESFLAAILGQEKKGRI